MKDSKENIWRLTLLTNPDKCNLACPLCFLNQKGTPFGMGEMPFHIIKSAISRYKESLKEIIPSTMGEPLLYSHFSSLQKLCIEEKILINLTTNGSFPYHQSSLARTLLLQSCSDIKISLMAFSEGVFSKLMPGLSLSEWKQNVSSLSSLRKNMLKESSRISTLSLQVTLNKFNIDSVKEIIEYAASQEIARIKWNVPVFLSSAPANFKEEYGLPSGVLNELKENIRNLSSEYSLQSAGSLFFNSSADLKSKTCPFQGELWVYPDGSESHCPNPERRFGNHQNAAANCTSCPLK